MSRKSKYAEEQIIRTPKEVYRRVHLLKEAAA